MQMECALGIDIGTSACKVAAFGRDGTVIASAAEEYGTFYPKPGWAEQNPKDWWAASCKAISKVLGQPGVSAKEVAGVGIAGQSWASVAIGKDGDAIGNTPIWMDTRAGDICAELAEKVGEKRIFETSGNPLQPSYTTAKVVWQDRNSSEKAVRVLQSNSYVAYKLTGSMTQDVSQGYGIHCFDMRKRSWDFGLCLDLGIRPEVLPDIHPCHEVIGTVSSQGALSGLLAGTPVVAGGLDAACATLGVGAIHAGEAQEQGGQAGGMSICMDQYIADPRLILGCHVVPNLWLLQGGTTGGGGVMRWLERELGAFEREEGIRLGKSSLEILDELASAINPGSDGVLFLPYMAGERSPIWSPNAKGVFYGLDYSKSKGHMVRAALEGVAFSLRHNMEVAALAGAHADVLRSMGGAANSRLWTQMKSDITQKPITVSHSDHATTLGAAILAGVGVGMFASFDEAVGLAVKTRRTHEPNAGVKGKYDEAFARYLGLYESLKGFMESQRAQIKTR
jgi:xylulokinase